jgi:hypothetical protein
MNTGDIKDYGITIFLLAWVIGFFWYSNVRSRSILEKWAAENSLEILHFKKEWNTDAQFSGMTSKGQAIYSVKVRDHAGNERSGWVRCGSCPGGVLFSNKAEVIWKDDVA